MEQWIRSVLTGRMYSNDETLRIVNIAQATFYMQNGLLPVDIYPSKDFKTGKDILVFIFNRADSKPLFDQWCKQER